MSYEIHQMFNYSDDTGVPRHLILPTTSVLNQWLNHLKTLQTKPGINGNFVLGIYWWPVDSLHKGTIMQKVFPCHDVIMSPKIANKNSLGVLLYYIYIYISVNCIKHRNMFTWHQDVSGGVSGGCILHEELFIKGPTVTVTWENRIE